MGPLVLTAYKFDAAELSPSKLSENRIVSAGKVALMMVLVTLLTASMVYSPLVARASEQMTVSLFS